MPPQDDFETKDAFETQILGIKGHKARLYDLLDANGNQVGKIRDAVTAGGKHVYASEVIHLSKANPNTLFRYEIHAYFGDAGNNCAGQPFIQEGGTFTTDQHGRGHHRVVVGEPGNLASKNPIPIPPQVTGQVIHFKYWVKAQDGSTQYSTNCQKVYEPPPGGPHEDPFKFP